MWQTFMNTIIILYFNSHKNFNYKLLIFSAFHLNYNCIPFRLGLQISLSQIPSFMSNDTYTKGHHSPFLDEDATLNPPKARFACPDVFHGL